jgi:hypothetical protein
VKKVKEVRIASCTFVFSCLFTLCEYNLFGGKEVRAPMRGKVTVEKALKRAGATPIFRLSAAQKAAGVAPALRR